MENFPGPVDDEMSRIKRIQILRFARKFEDFAVKLASFFGAVPRENHVIAG